MKIADFPKEGRPRERFLKLGAGVLSDAELLAIILRTGRKGENVVDMSNRIISEHGLDKMFDCSLKELQGIKGIGPGKAMQLLAISEINKRVSLAKNPINKITCAKDVFELFHQRLKDEKQENFIVLMLNTKNHVIQQEHLTKGILDASIIDQREVFKSAIRNSSAKIILIHNHPSGDPSPSEEDKDVTMRLIEAGELLGIKVLDHVIVGRDGWWSWKESLN